MKPKLPGSIPPEPLYPQETGTGFPFFGVLAAVILCAGGYYGYLKMQAPDEEVTRELGALSGESTVQREEPTARADGAALSDRPTGAEASPPEPKKTLTEAEIARYVSQVDVKLYATSWCGYCKKARAYFSANGVAYREFDIERDAAAKAKKEQLSPEDGVPVVEIEGQVISGFRPSSYARAIREAVRKASGVPVVIQFKTE